MWAFALMPTLSRALAAAGSGGAWTEVCTVQGPRWLPVEGAGEPAAPAGLHALDHCAFCALHAAGAAPLPALPPTLPLPALAEPVPALFLHAPRPLFAWLSAPARAPPSVS